MHRNALFADSLRQPQGPVGNGLRSVIDSGILEPLRQSGIGAGQLGTVRPDGLEELYRLLGCVQRAITLATEPEHQ